VARFNYYVEGRAFEWVLALSMILLSAEVLIWPQTLQAGAFQIVLMVVSTHFIGVLLLLLGWAKCVGLMLNGQTFVGYRAGPYIRAAASVVSSVMWGQFTIALLHISIERGRPAVMMTFWFMFTIGELYVAYTTVKNA
jgi:hypothetical protein